MNFAHQLPAAVAPQGPLPFEDEATALMSARAMRRSRRLIHATGAIVVVLLVWAALAHVDEVTRGDARVIPSRQLQVVQSFDGGIVSEILVREGQTVEAGQVLLRIDETRATSGVRESAAQGVALRARAARLRALAEGGAFIPPKGTNADEKRVIDDERRLHASRSSEMQTSLSVVRQQIVQRQNETAEAQARRSAAQRGMDLAQRELDQTRPLLASGAVSPMDILRLERDVSRLRGEIEQAVAQHARAQASISEAQRKLEEVNLTARNDARKELAEVSAKLSALDEGAVALADRVDKAQVKSPVRGRVQRLLANTVGGVVTPGKDIVEIVPLDDALILEARVSPRDIAFIRPDQNAMVKFTAYDFSIYGGLDAKVENISPDSTVDDKGNAYYLVRVRTARSWLEHPRSPRALPPETASPPSERPNGLEPPPSIRVIAPKGAVAASGAATSPGDALPIIPGMTAEVDVLTGRKSVLSYLLEPVLKVQASALRER